MSNTDPAQQQEGASDDATTVTDPQVTEAEAESPEESGEGAGAPHEDQEAKDAEAEAEVEIVVDGEEPPPAKKKTEPWVKELRKKQDLLAAENAELKRRLQGQMQPDQAADPGPEPTLENCDFDGAVFKEKLASWLQAQERKKADSARQAQQAEAQQRAWQSRLDVYAKGKDELSKQIPEYGDAEAAVKASLDVARQSVLLSVADNPALVVCALGQRPKLLEEFAKETDPLRFAVKLAKLEANLKTQKKPQAPPPEKPVTGSGSKSGTADSHLEKLRAQADKSGDRTAVVEYLRKKREAAR